MEHGPTSSTSPILTNRSMPVSPASLSRHLRKAEHMQLSKNLDRPLYYINSLAIFWFLAFIIIGPKYTAGSSVLLLLGLVTLPFNLASARATLKQQAPWVIGLLVYTLFLVTYRALEGLPADKLDPPFRFLAAIPILIHLGRYGFHPATIGLGAAIGCLIGGSAGIQEVMSGRAFRAGQTIAHNPIPYGTLVAILTMCALHATVTLRARLLQVVCLAGTLVGLVAVVLSGTRGLIPGIFLAVAYLGYSMAMQAGISKSRLAVFAAAGLVATGLLAYQAPVVKYRFAESQAEVAALQSGNLNFSLGVRLQMWHSALHLLAQNPALGVGTEQDKRDKAAAAFLAEKNYNPRLFKDFDHLHSEYFDTLASYGLAGLAALLALLVGTVLRAPFPDKVPLMMVLAIIAVEALTETVFVDTKLAMGFVFLVTALRAQAFAQRERTTEAAPRHPPLAIPRNGL